MKVRVLVPDTVKRRLRNIAEYADDIILWAMEMDQVIDVYGLTYDASDGTKRSIPKDQLYSDIYTAYHGLHFRDQPLWLVFIIDADFMMFFMLRWGASKHKYSAKDVEFF